MHKRDDAKLMCCGLQKVHSLVIFLVVVSITTWTAAAFEPVSLEWSWEWVDAFCRVWSRINVISFTGLHSTCNKYLLSVSIFRLKSMTSQCLCLDDWIYYCKPSRCSTTLFALKVFFVDKGLKIVRLVAYK